MEHHDKSIVASFTIVLAISTILLWLETRKLWEETRRTAQRQEADTKILQRAYIAAIPLGIEPYISKDGSRYERIVGHVGLVNVGRLPARNISTRQAKMKWFPKKDIG